MNDSLGNPLRESEILLLVKGDEYTLGLYMGIGIRLFAHNDIDKLPKAKIFIPIRKKWAFDDVDNIWGYREVMGRLALHPTRKVQYLFRRKRVIGDIGLLNDYNLIFNLSEITPNLDKKLFKKILKGEHKQIQNQEWKNFEHQILKKSLFTKIV